MNWIKVNNENEATLPPLEKVVHVIYLNDGDDGQMLATGARTDGGEGWLWAINYCYDYARSDGFAELYTDDDYRVTDWAEIEWPED